LSAVPRKRSERRLERRDEVSQEGRRREETRSKESDREGKRRCYVSQTLPFLERALWGCFVLAWNG
jgi:hypothetical protein